MSTRRDGLRHRGYFAIGIEHGKTKANLGTLWRSADVLGAAFVFTIGARYTPQNSDTMKTWRRIPLVTYLSVEDLHEHLPYSCPLVGVELDPGARPIEQFAHPERAVYLLGAEDRGLSPATLRLCHHVIALPGDHSLNVAVAGSLVMFDRVQRRARAAKSVGVP